MNKGVFGRHFGRTKNQRKALFRGLITSLVENGEISTTISKAKAIKAQAEKMITKGKRGTLSDIRIIFGILNKKILVNKLVNEIAPLFKDRNGGYLKIVRLGTRKGDQAEMVKLLFTEEIVKAEVVKSEKEKTKVKKEQKNDKTN